MLIFIRNDIELDLSELTPQRGRSNLIYLVINEEKIMLIDECEKSLFLIENVTTLF